MMSRQFGRALWAMLRMSLWFVLDLSLKFASGIGIVLLVWLPFRLFFHSPIRWWLLAGAVFGAMLNGFWELSDVFALKRLLGIDALDEDA